MFLNATKKALEQPKGTVITLQRNQILYLRKLNISINNSSEYSLRYCAVSSLVLYIANAVKLSDNEVYLNVTFIIDPYLYSIYYDTTNKSLKKIEADVLVLKGKETIVTFQSHNWIHLSNLRFSLCNRTIQNNFKSEFEVQKEIKKKYAEECFTVKRYKDKKLFFCRKYYITPFNKTKQMSKLNNLLKLNSTLRDKRIVETYKWIYEFDSSIVMIYEYYKQPLTYEIPYKYTDTEINRILKQLLKLAVLLHNNGLVLVKFEQKNFRLMHEDRPIGNNELILTHLDDIVDHSYLAEVGKICKRKLHLAPEILDSDLTLNPLSVSVFGIGAFLCNILLSINPNLLKLRNMQEINYIKLVNLKHLNTLGHSDSRKLISYSIDKGYGYFRT